MSYDRDSRLAAACVMGSYDGSAVPSWLVERIESGLGGVCLFAQNVVDDAQVAATTAALRGAVVAIDEEGGDVTRLDARHGSETPCPAAFGVVDDPSLTRSAFSALGTRVAGLGIDLVLAPCADINSNDRNPIIGVRSFGATASVASRHTVACIGGFHDGGVAACVKHFPGHGDTVADTHLGAARVEATLEEMEHRELVPFRAAIAAGVDAVLTAHIVAGGVDERPASLSRRWTNYLRDVLGFDGVIVTDALDMGAVSGRGVPAAAVDALIAGADLLCLGSNFDAAQTDAVVAAVAAAVNDGRVDRTALEQSAARISKLRRNGPSPVAVDGGSAAEIARQAIIVKGSVPADIHNIVECRPQPSMASFNVTWGLARHLTELGWHAQQVAEGSTIDTARLGDNVVVVAVRDLDVHPWQRDVVDTLSSTRQVVVVELGWPSPTPPPVAAYIVSHGAALASTQAVADLLTRGLV